MCIVPQLGGTASFAVARGVDCLKITRNSSLAILRLPGIVPPLVPACGVAVVAVLHHQFHVVQQHGGHAAWVVLGQINPNRVILLFWQWSQLQQIYGDPVGVKDPDIARRGPHRVSPVDPFLVSGGMG